MPRLSLYRENHSNDYKYQDKLILELFVAGCVGINVHKYLGSGTNTDNSDLTQPAYANQSEQNIQDLLFLENRDRKYDADIYNLRGHYTIQDIDFNLAQFGLFINNDTLYITFHINDMVARLGRKLMAGDVLELPHRRDYYPLNDNIPTALKKFYVIQECTFASEGYAPTWWPHLWRCKVTPMVNSQEYADILNQQAVNGDGVGTGFTLGSMMSTYLSTLAVNDAIIAQAEKDVPKSGYDTTELYILPTDPNASPTHDTLGYLVGDGKAPNGLQVITDVAFPVTPVTGQFVLRTDYFPHKLFRFSGHRWVPIENEVRAPLTGNTNITDRGTFVNNHKKTRLANGAIIDQRQALSSLLKINPDKLG
jgi:hypothetical protein